MTLHRLALLALLLPTAVSAAPTMRERARAQDPAALPFFRDALQSDQPGERAEAAWAAGQLGFAEPPEGSTDTALLSATRAAAADALAAAVSDPDAGVRRAAVEGLGKVGDARTESFLLAAATDADPGVRGEAALALFRERLLKRVPEFSSAAVSRLGLLAQDADPEVRWRTAYALSKWAEPRAALALGSLQSDADPRARLFAVRGLAKIHAAPELARLSDPDPYVRAEAVGALSAAKEWDKLPAGAFTDPSPHVRAAAADAAAESGDARFAGALERLASEPGTLAPGRALIALARVKAPGAAAALEKARSSPSWWLRSRAYEASALLPDAEKLLLEGLADPDPRVASQALESLAATTSTAAAAAIDRVLKDPKAPLELTGSAIEAAAQRASPDFLDGLFAAMKRAQGPGAAELRGDLREALRAIAKNDPARAEELNARLKKFPEFTDKPRRFKPLKAPPSVLFETEKGSFTIRLASAADAGNHVAAFADSVKKHLYDGLIWHRVVTAFVVQGGDPRGSGWGDAGWRLADEANRLPFSRGAVGMPKAGPDTGGCQLFISLVPTPHLDGRYTAFGQVTDGLEALDRLEPGDKILRASLRP